MVAQLLSTDVNSNPVPFHDKSDQRGRRGSVERHEAFQEGIPDGLEFMPGAFSPLPTVRTIIEQPGTIYFSSLGISFADNTTDDLSDFGGHALTQKHLQDLAKQGLNPRDINRTRPLPDGTDQTFETLLELVQFDAENIISEQFVEINGFDVTPSDIEGFKQETQNLSYDDLPRNTGGLGGDPEKILLADPDLGNKLGDGDPSNDQFPTLAEVKKSSQKEFVVPFVQAGYYAGFRLHPGTQKVEFGSKFQIQGQTVFQQDITYNILKPIIGTNRKDFLLGTKKGDYIEGGKRKDILLGKAGDDLLVGGSDPDILVGGPGDDELWGDEGPDSFSYSKGDGMDKIFYPEKGDVIKVLGLKELEPMPIMSNGVDSTEFDFGEGNSLTIVGVTVENLELTDNFFGTTITFLE